MCRHYGGWPTSRKVPKWCLANVNNILKSTCWNDFIFYVTCSMNSSMGIELFLKDYFFHSYLLNWPQNI